jgi:hypothetical protein
MTAERWRRLRVGLRSEICAGRLRRLSEQTEHRQKQRREFSHRESNLGLTSKVNTEVSTL